MKKIYIILVICNCKNRIFKLLTWGLGIGDWGLAQSPIPNPQSPIKNN